MKKHTSVVFGSVSLILLAATQDPAFAITWDGSGDTAWTNAANWSGSAVPGNGDNVVVPNGMPNNPALPAGTYPTNGTFASFEVEAGAVVTCLGDTGVVNEASGGTAGNPHGTGVTINVSGDATIGGTLDADQHGFAAGTGPAKGNNYIPAGGYGGEGGSLGTDVYGSLEEPTALGSGGGTAFGRSGPGGGAIRVNVGGTLSVNGTVTARGDTGAYGTSGASGGSIWLTANAFAGTGAVNADGGDVVNPSGGGGGGGGRVSIEYATSTFSGTVSVAGGIGSGTSISRGQSGTLWEPGRYAGLEGSGGSPVSMTITNGFQYHFTNGAPVHYWNLATSAEWIEFHNGSLAINDLSVTNASILRFDSGRIGTDYYDMRSLSVSGSLVVSNASELYLPAEGIYDLSGNLVVASAAVLYPLGNTTNANTTSGGSVAGPHGIGVTISAAGNATIVGTVNGDQQGFLQTDGPAPAGHYAPGAGHGGQGGGSSYAAYGALAQPTALGSGASTAFNKAPGAGGGAFSLRVAGTLALNGTITVDGDPSGSSSGGAGGSIWLTAGTLAGGGTLTADGGSGGTTRNGGGGGRISLDYGASTFGGSISVDGGAAGGPGQTGTLFVCHSPVPRTYAGGGGGVTLASSFDSDDNGSKIARTVSRWRVFPARIEWSDESTYVGGGQLDNEVDYVLNGLTPSAEFYVFTNDVQMGASTVQSSAGGLLAISNIVLTAAHKTRVEARIARGTLVIIH